MLSLIDFLLCADAFCDQCIQTCCAFGHRSPRIIAEAPRVAEETSRRQREELLIRASEGRSRLDVSVTLQDKRWGDDSRVVGRRVSMRRERREGRIVFLVLVIALCVAVIWLVSHLHF